MSHEKRGQRWDTEVIYWPVVKSSHRVGGPSASGLDPEEGGGCWSPTLCTTLRDLSSLLGLCLSFVFVQLQTVCHPLAS